jgi:hypothetical protein
MSAPLLSDFGQEVKVPEPSPLQRQWGARLNRNV